MLLNDLDLLIGKSISSYSFSNVNQQNQALMVPPSCCSSPHNSTRQRLSYCECFLNSTLALSEFNEVQNVGQYPQLPMEMSLRPVREQLLVSL